MNLSILNDADFDSVFDLMSSSFPKDEMRSREKQFLLLDKEEYQLWGVKDGNLLCGFFALWEFSDFIYIEHFAVAEHMRCSGFGGKMLDLLCSTAKKQIILESELPENELAVRRINFYIRHGFYKNGYPYIQPPCLFLGSCHTIHTQHHASNIGCFIRGQEHKRVGNVLRLAQTAQGNLFDHRFDHFLGNGLHHAI